jgi:hypothetical protein
LVGDRGFDDSQIAWEDGEIEKTHHFERPQIWLKDGKPAMLFVAISRKDKKDYFNLYVPLQSLEQIQKK